jgi:3-hydroxyacyl-CoA dehydrogenase/enoyl-CoA hydratase/3-hydroxybutyryl-CoA epimerase
LSVIRLLGGAAAMEEVAVLEALVEKGKLGKKSGEGFYSWKKSKAVKNKDAIQGINLKSLATELMQPYLDECQACLADGVVANSDFLDAGMIFGTGFAPFRGGPLHYLSSLNHDQLSPSLAGKESVAETAGESA